MLGTEDRPTKKRVAMTEPAIHILIVEDEPQIRTLLRGRFEKEGFRVSEASDGHELFKQLDSQDISLITLDLWLGGEDGLALAREIRAKHNLPIIIISGKDDEIDRVVGLELGADDYVTKPFSPREVVARVRAVLRRYETTAPTQTTLAPAGLRYAFAGGTLDVSRRSLTSPSGEPIVLTTADFNLIELFLRHPQRVLTRDDIMTVLKGHDWNPVDRSVDSAVARLRKKIEPDPEEPNYIKTVRNVGYVFTGDVRKG